MYIKIQNHRIYRSIYDAHATGGLGSQEKVDVCGQGKGGGVNVPSNFWWHFCKVWKNMGAKNF